MEISPIWHFRFLNSISRVFAQKVACHGSSSVVDRCQSTFVYANEALEQNSSSGPERGWTVTNGPLAWWQEWSQGFQEKWGGGLSPSAQGWRAIFLRSFGWRAKISDLHKSLSFPPEGHEEEASFWHVAKCHRSFCLSRKISFLK